MGGVPHLHSIILPLVPCPFWGQSSDWSQVPSQGYSSPRQGVPHPGMRMGCPPNQVRMGYPGQDWGTTLSWVRMGYPPLARTRAPPQARSVWGTPRGQNSRASTCYTAGGMLLAFTQEECLVSTNSFKVPLILNEVSSFTSKSNNMSSTKLTCFTSK